MKQEESEPYMKCDFDDYGHITGNYWIWSENEQSKIPGAVGRTVSLGIDRIMHSIRNDEEQGE